LHVATHQTVLIREICISEGDDPASQVKDYCHHVRILKKFRRTPFLLPFLAFTIETPTFWIIMPFYTAGFLSDYCRSNSRQTLTASQQTVIALGIAHGMRRIHHAKLLHRNLKSSNIVLQQSGSKLIPWITDFGLARKQPPEQGGLTRACGTTNWMAPELLQTHCYDSKVDVYSFGLLLYEMLCHKIPFGDLDGKTCEREVCRGRRPELPGRGNAAIRKLIRKCWDPEPKKRPTFKEIYVSIKTGKYVFDGTTEEEMREMRSLLREPGNMVKSAYAVTQVTQ
jgi:serine/threonine protein kinase